MMAAVTLGLGDYGVIGVMLGVVASIIVALTLGNIKAVALMITALGIRIDRIEDRLTSVEKTKTDKHEWARETLAARSKMEKLSGQLKRIDGKLEANFGIAASVNRLTDELAKYWEAGPHDQRTRRT